MEEQRRKDPVKRAIYVGVLLLAASLVWWSSTLLKDMINKQELARIQAQTQSLTNEYSQVQISRQKISEAQTRLDALDKLTSARFLQGSLLNALQMIYVPNVQLTRLRIDQSYSLTGGVPAKTNSFGVVAGRPAMTTERLVLTLDAKDFSPSPGDQVNKYKSAVTQLDYFKSILDLNNGVRLSSLSPLQSSPDGKPYVLFTLEYRFLDKTQ